MRCRPTVWKEGFGARFECSWPVCLGRELLLLEIVIVGRDLGVGVIVCVFNGMRDFTSRWIMASGLPDPKMLQDLLDLPAIA